MIVACGGPGEAFVLAEQVRADWVDVVLEES